MITKVLMPKLSDAMETGKVIKWLHKEGDTIKGGDVIAEIETDKANVEIEAFGSVVLRKIVIGPGGQVPVGDLIGVIADPSDFEILEGRLLAKGQPVDLVYNRLTDFYFENPRHQVLRTAYIEELAVFTPHPRAHALYADKRNLALLSDANALRGHWVPDELVQVLEALFACHLGSDRS